MTSGLLVLINAGLITFYPPRPPGDTYYEADEFQAYNLLRMGHNLEIIRDRFGDLASDALSSCFVLGLVNETDLIKDLASRGEGGKLLNEDRVNGGLSAHSAEDWNHTVVAETIEKLVEHSYLEPVREYSFMSNTDMDIVVGAWLRSNDPKFEKSITGPKKSSEFHAAREEKKARIKRGIDQLEDPNLTDTDDDDPIKNRPIKKPRLEQSTGLEDTQDVSNAKSGEIPARQSKRGQKPNEDDTKVSDGEEQGHSAQGMDGGDDPWRSYREAAEQSARQSPQRSGEVRPEEATNVSGGSLPSQPDPSQRADFFRPNQMRFLKAVRSQILTEFASRKLGSTTGRVYGTLLLILENAEIRSQIRADGDDEIDVNQFSASTSDIEKALEPSLMESLQSEFGRTQEPDAAARNTGKEKSQSRGETAGLHDSVTHSTSQPKNGIVKEKHKPATAKRASLTQLLDDQLAILADDPDRFVHFDEHYGQWSVDHARLIKLLGQAELEKIINARFGPVATRLVRILHKKGKLEEKQIGSLGLIQQKDLRYTLSSMQDSAYVEVQEIPRDTTRQANKTMYLWTYDQDRCQNVVLDQIYKTMSRLLQRYELEKHAVSGLLEKSQRTDVQGREDLFLSKAEQEGLKEWRGKEEKMQIQLARLDQLVLIFRDIPKMNSEDLW